MNAILKDLGLEASNAGTWTAAGGWLADAAGGRIDSINPTTGEVIASVTGTTAAQYEQVMASAAAIAREWRNVPAPKRGEVVRLMAEELRKHKQALGRLVSLEMGKILAEGAGEVQEMIDIADFAVGQSRMLYGLQMHSERPNHRMFEQWHPLGVVGVISAFNFPVAVWSWNAFLAAICGNVTVWKPSPKTALCAVAVQRLCEGVLARHGLPGIFQLFIDGGTDLASRFIEDRRVDLVSFTGSTAVGRLLMKQCAPTIKKLSLELGGNAPFIVFDDADLDAAADGALASKYRNSGQTCVCANRIYVQAGVHDAFVEKLTARAKSIKVGNGFEAGVTQGPVIDGRAIRKIEAHVADALAKGARLVAGGRRSGERFFQPTVLADVSSTMLCAREETFGPVAPVFRFKTEAEAIALANDTEFGLASYFYSRDIGRIFRVGEALEYGMVGINTGLISTAEVPFGGVKQSGLGREGARQGVDDYVEIKYLCLGDILK